MSRHWLILLIPALALPALARRPGEPERLSAPAARFQFEGSGGCAAAGCHNAKDRRDRPGSEYSTWATLDPHSKSYGVLFNETSKTMIAALGRPKEAHRDAQCLACHAPLCPKVDQNVAGDFRSDAVGCEACHGASSGYRTTHYLPGFDRASSGMVNTKNLSDRVAACAKCHVGAPGQEVDHDLIAAGHPRLLFEYAAYHDLLPRHWREPDEGSGFTAKAWAVGRVGTALASVDLLASRAGRSNPWPELSESNCYACHHDLTGKGRAATPAGIAGIAPYGRWNLAGLDDVGKLGTGYAPPTPIDVAPLRRLMEQALPPADQVAKAAGELKSSLALWRVTLRSAPTPVEANVRDALQTLSAADRSGDWEEAGQHYLALVALNKAYAGQLRSPPAFETLRGPLLFPAISKDGRRVNGPSEFTVERYLRGLQAVREAVR